MICATVAEIFHICPLDRMCGRGDFAKRAFHIRESTETNTTPARFHLQRSEKRNDFTHVQPLLKGDNRMPFQGISVNEQAQPFAYLNEGSVNTWNKGTPRPSMTVRTASFDMGRPYTAMTQSR